MLYVTYYSWQVIGFSDLKTVHLFTTLSITLRQNELYAFLSLHCNFSLVFLGSSLKTILSVKIPNCVLNCKCNINLKGSNIIIAISSSLCQLSIC